MAEYNKDKYYWLKLKRDFFKRHDIKIIESQPNGKEYVLFYLKLMVESIDHDGELRFSQQIPYDLNMLSVITNTNIDTVRQSVKLLNELGMIDILDDQTIYMTEVRGLIGMQTVGAEKKQLQRQKAEEEKRGREGGTIVHQRWNNSPPEIELEKEKELDIDISQKESDREKDIYKNDFFDVNIPTLQEIQEFITLKDVDIDAERFYNYYSARGWKMGNTPIEDWRYLILEWARKKLANDRLKDQPEVIKTKIIEPQFEERKYTSQDMDNLFNGDISALNISDDDI